MHRLASLKKSRAIEEALARIDALEPEYASAVQRLIARGPWAVLIQPVDAARERMVQLGLAWAVGQAQEDDVIAAAGGLATLMAMVIGTQERPDPRSKASA